MTDLEEVPSDDTPLMYERLPNLHRPDLVPSELPEDGGTTPPRMYRDTNMKKVLGVPDEESNRLSGLTDA